MDDLLQKYPVIRALGWSTVKVIIDLESARIFHKSLNSDAPSYMSDMFTKGNVSTTRSLRNSDDDLRVPFLRTTIGQRCFSYQGAKLWNGLFKKTKNTSTLKDFYESQKMILCSRRISETSLSVFNVVFFNFFNDCN